MKNLLKPHWILWITLIPFICVFVIYYGVFDIIESRLDEEDLQYWWGFGITLFVSGLLSFAYGLIRKFQRKYIDLIYGISSLLFYTTFLYVYMEYQNDIIPFSIPEWMIPRDMFLYLGTFIMPTLIHSLLVVIIHLTKDINKPKIWLQFVIAIVIPLLWYIFFMVIQPLWRSFDLPNYEHLFSILLVSATVFFLFFLIRGIYLLVSRKSSFFVKYQLFWKIPIAVVFPLLGLLLNNGHFNEWYLGGESGIFGNFNHPLYYLIALINGILLCLPRFKNPNIRLGLFAVKSITFTYILYFFLVFLPYLPLSIIAIVIFGLGFLMLAPLMIFVLQIVDLSNDFKFLKAHFNKRVIYIVFSFGVIILPASLIVDFQHDRRVLNEALDFVYSPALTQPETIRPDPNRLYHVLTHVLAHKNRRWSGPSFRQTPFISPLYNKLVLDNLTLSDEKIRQLQEIFVGHTFIPFDSWWNWNIPTNDDVKITSVISSSEYNETDKYWTSEVILDLYNNENRRAEYETVFEIPDGCWIENYHLWIEGDKVPGILCERKTATWVYQQITNTNRDPGLLRYIGENKISLRIFPFLEKENRKTSITFIHKEPLEFEIDSEKVKMGEYQKGIKLEQTSIQVGNSFYIPKNEISQLDTVYRTPDIYYIVDASEGNSIITEQYIRNIKDIRSKIGTQVNSENIVICNTYSRIYPLSENWEKRISTSGYYGGFFAERAIQKILVNSDAKSSSSYPYFVILTDDVSNFVTTNGFKDFGDYMPERNPLVIIDSTNVKLAYNFLNFPSDTGEVWNGISPFPTLAFPNRANALAYIKISSGPEVIHFPSENEVVSNELSSTDKFTQATTLEYQWQAYLQDKSSQESWLNLIKYSFQVQLLSPVTAFICLENESQRKALLKKQEDVLNGSKTLDLGEDVDQMDEPGLWFALILLMILYGIYKSKKKLGHSS